MTELLITVLLLAGNATFVGGEFALIASRRTVIEPLAATSQMYDGAPPRTLTRRILPFAKNPTSSPLGEKNTPVAPSVPSTARADVMANCRTYTLVLLPWLDT